MNTEAKRNALDLPLPEGRSLRRRKFGGNPVSQPAHAPVSGDKGDSADPRPEFRLRWEDAQMGLEVIVRERDGGHLIADVYSTHVAHRDKVKVSVSIVGTHEYDLIRKEVPLDIPEMDGCSGSADFGSLADATKELGSPLRLIVSLLG